VSREAPGDRRGERVLVRGPNWLGDLVMATPGFRALREGLPDAHLVLHVRPGLEGLLQGSRLFDEVRPVASYHRGLRAIRREGQALRQQGFSLGLCIPESFSSALLLHESGAPRRIGYGGPLRSRLLSDPVAVPREWGRRRWVAKERFVLELVESLGCSERGIELELETSPEPDRAARELVRAGATAGRSSASGGEVAPAPLVLLAPGAGYGDAKRWPARHFAALARGLADAGARVALIGGSSERDLGAAIVREAGAGVLDLSGRLDLPLLKSVVRLASLLVCNDSGARHIATAFRVPTFVLFGPTALSKTNANLERTSVFENDTRCRPCYLRSCPIDHRCLAGIPPAALLDRALAVAFEARTTGAAV